MVNPGLLESPLLGQAPGFTKPQFFLKAYG